MTYTAVTKAGFDSLQWSHRASTGYMTGIANLTSASTNTGSTMGRVKGTLNANITLPQPTVVNILGDDTRIAVYQFDSTEPITFEVEMSVHDFTFLTGTHSVDAVTESAEVMLPFGMTGVTYNGLILLFSSKAKSQVSATLNSAGYSHILLFNCEVTDLGSSFAHQTANTRRLRITANTSAYLPDGRTVASVFADVPGGVCAGIEFTSANRVTFVTFVGDNSAVNIPTSQKPVSTGTSKGTVETTGFAAATISSVDDSTPYNLVYSAAPGSGKFAVARHEFVSWE